jgi:ferredoxin--NADP+ reductase
MHWTVRDGRRDRGRAARPPGPAQAAFTNPELRELGELQRADVIVDPAQLEACPEPEDTIKRHNVEILRDDSRREPGANHTVARRLGADASVAGHQPVDLELRFLRSPIEVLGEGEDAAFDRLPRPAAGGNPFR